MKLAVGVVAYKQSPHEINAVLKSAMGALQVCGTHVVSDLLVFDNGGTLSQHDLIEGIRLFQNGLNDGFGRSQNHLMQIAFDAGADYYIGANPDGAFHPDCINNLLKMAQRCPRCKQPGAGSLEQDVRNFPELGARAQQEETLGREMARHELRIGRAIHHHPGLQGRGLAGRQGAGGFNAQLVPLEQFGKEPS